MGIRAGPPMLQVFKNWYLFLLYNIWSKLIISQNILTLRPILENTGICINPSVLNMGVKHLAGLYWLNKLTKSRNDLNLN